MPPTTRAYTDISMTIPAATDLYTRSLKARPRHEWASAWVYRPLAHLVVRMLLPLPITPPMLVLFHTVLGVIAGVLVASGGFAAAALLYQIKTVLDNADGQLARAKNQVTEIGRFLDSEMDLVVNIAAFWGIAVWSGQYGLCLLGFVVFTLIQSLDFNAEYLYQHARGQAFRPQPESSHENQRILAGLRWVYAVVYAPQDRILRNFSQGRFDDVVNGIVARFPQTKLDPERLRQGALAYWDGEMHAVVANFGLSSQMGLLGLCLIVGQPLAFVWLQCGQFAVLAWLQARAEARLRRVLSV
jgi:archaetidylinositol phosphate synthase